MNSHSDDNSSRSADTSAHAAPATEPAPMAYVEPTLGVLPEKLSIHIAETEVTHNGPCGVQQHYNQYSAEEHETWHILFTRQLANLQDIAYTPWLKAIDDMGLSADRCPSFADLSRRLRERTGWTVVGVEGFLHGRDYFWYLANKLFPAVPRLRPRAQLEFIVEPDLFHDAFGHVPMHSNRLFAEFVELYGKVALQLIDNPDRAKELGRLYWFTVEYGLIHEGGTIKVCGSGHLSGIKESRYSLTDRVKKIPFNMEKVINQDYNPHILQETLFVLDSYEQLVDAMKKKAAEFGIEVTHDGSPVS